MEKLAYGGWPNCCRLTNDVIDLVVTTDVGPRIIRFGFAGDTNEFKEYPELMGRIGGDTWRIYGGHRLWHAPEQMPRSYIPDNEPVAVEQHNGFVRVIQQPEASTGIQKEIDITLAPQAAQVQLTHRLRNTGMWAVELAPWALSVMAPGGTVIVPHPPRKPHTEEVRPANTMTLWTYTDMSDPRWTWGHKYILLRQDEQRPEPQKIGMLVTDGWVAYARAGHLFIKQFEYLPGARYPDIGCSVETFTNGDMLEVETLAPLRLLEPGAVAEHVERWSLHRNIAAPTNDSDVEQHILPLVEGRR